MAFSIKLKKKIEKLMNKSKSFHFLKKGKKKEETFPCFRIKSTVFTVYFNEKCTPKSFKS